MIVLRVEARRAADHGRLGSRWSRGRPEVHEVHTVHDRGQTVRRHPELVPRVLRHALGHRHHVGRQGDGPAVERRRTRPSHAMIRSEEMRTGTRHAHPTSRPRIVAWNINVNRIWIRSRRRSRASRTNTLRSALRTHAKVVDRYADASRDRRPMTPDRAWRAAT